MCPFPFFTELRTGNSFHSIFKCICWLIQWWTSSVYSILLLNWHPMIFCIFFPAKGSQWNVVSSSHLSIPFSSLFIDLSVQILNHRCNQRCQNLNKINHRVATAKRQRSLLKIAWSHWIVKIPFTVRYAGRRLINSHLNSFSFASASWIRRKEIILALIGFKE